VTWVGGLAEWEDGDVTFLSVAGWRGGARIDVPCPENERSAITAEESGIRSAGIYRRARWLRKRCGLSY
jgi:hypothetical protein